MTLYIYGYIRLPSDPHIEQMQMRQEKLLMLFIEQTTYQSNNRRDPWYHINQYLDESHFGDDPEV